MNSPQPSGKLGDVTTTQSSDCKKGPKRRTPKAPIAKRVEARRMECGLSRRALAAHLGLGENAFNERLVAGNLRADEVEPLSVLLQCPMEWLLTGET